MHPFPLEQTEGPAHGRGEGGTMNLVRQDRSPVTIAPIPKIAILRQVEVYVCVALDRMALAQSGVSTTTGEGNVIEVRPLG